MSKRSERREAERQTRKLAYLAQRQPQQADQSHQPPVEVAEAQPPAVPVSEARLAANRANAKLSTGPVTEAGRARSSRNALTYGLTGKTVLLPSEDAARYQRELDELIHHYQPATDDELRLVHSLNECAWRLDRIQRIEVGLLLKGDIECASKYEDRSEWERKHLIQAEAYIKYEKQLRNLNIQEGRLLRIAEKARAELLLLRTTRQREEAKLPAVAKASGFEYSNPDKRRGSVPNPPLTHQTRYAIPPSSEPQASGSSCSGY